MTINPMAKKKIKQSDILEVMRSQINLNPYNPKRHSDKKILEQKKNLLRMGLMGGITWNRKSGNLIDGHRRIKAMDLHYGYDGTSVTDYSVKVSVVDLDKKQEKEQMTYMALGNTKADYSLIAEYLPDIDAVAAGIDDYDLSQIRSFIPTLEEIQVESFDDLISNNEEDKPVPSDEEKKAKIKDAKQKQKDAIIQKAAYLDAYITISFDSEEEKQAFCDFVGVSIQDKFVKGSTVMNAFE